MNNLAFATITQLQELLHTKKISRKELLDFFLKRFAHHDPTVGSALEVFDAESILKTAANDGPLSGIPGILKDNIAQEGRRLTCASKILQNFVSTFDATATTRLKNAGALIVGRANMDEFAMGSSTEYSAYQKTCNPWDISRVPGGSSGGSVAAVAAGLVPWALGTETGGSVRLPAAYCGVVGLKPTYGLISRYGLVAYGSSLDQAGVVTRTVQDNARVLSCVAGQDVKDSTSAPVSPTDYTRMLDGKIKPGLKIGVVENALHAHGMDTEVAKLVEQALAVYTKLGAQLVPVKLPTLDYGAAVYFIISRAELASNLSRFDGVRYGLRDRDETTLTGMYRATRHDGFGSEVKGRIIIGNYVLSAGHASDFYGNACIVRQLIRNEFAQTFKNVDVLVMPTSPTPAFAFGTFADNNLAMDLLDYFTCPINLAGIPAIAVPCGFTQNMPIGFQIVGPHLSEALLYQTAYAYEQQTSWHTMHPQQFA